MYKLTIRSINTRTAARALDFFGIHEISSKEIAGAHESGRPPSSVISDKYDPLLKKRDRLKNEEKDVNVTFGRMRKDSDNIPQEHGQFEMDETKKLYDTIDIKQMFVKESADGRTETFENVEEDWSQPAVGNQPYKIAEVNQSMELRGILRMLEKPKVPSLAANKPPLTFEFEETVEPTNRSDFGSTIHTAGKQDEQPVEHRPKILNTAEKHDEQPLEHRPKLLKELETKYGLEGMPLEDLDPMSEEYRRRSQESNMDFKFEKILDKKYDVDSHKTKPVKAAQYLNQIRAKAIEPSAKGLKHRLETKERIPSFMPYVKLDSLGFRDYTYQVPDWNSFRRVDIVDHIKKQIIYNNYDILAVNKPYGIASHDEEKNRETIDMNELIHEIGKSMNIKKVYLAHRLDKTTTGVLLFATSQERAANLNKLFKSDEIKKTYWCLTKGIPDPEEGIIDIPIGEHYVGGKVRSCPVPASLDEKLQLVKRWREARRAITEYHTIRATTQIALLEVKPRSGVKHQIRCHLGFGLNTPILGDHKYNSLSSMAPQKLPMQVLNAFHLRQEKVRTLPSHLHAKTIVIPGAKANGETLFINAPLPPHFVDNLKALKLYDDEIKRISS